jgi:hypothetical protein
MSNLVRKKDIEPKSLKDLIAETAAWDATFSEIGVKAEDLKFDPEAIRYGGERYCLDQMARSRFFAYAGAPVGYWEQHTPEFQAIGLSAHAARGDFGAAPVLVLRHGEVVTLKRGDLYTLPNSDVPRAVEEVLGRDSESLFVARISLTVESLDVDLVSPMKEITVRTGDIVQSGIHMVHRRFGMAASVIEAFIYRLVCTNGMTRRECKSQRTRKLPTGFPNNRALQMDQVRRLTQQNWNGLHRQLEELRTASERPVRVEELLTRWLQRARISPQNIMPRLRAAWEEEGSEETHYGAVNALTRVATHDRTLSERQRRVLASLAGLLAFSEVHICPRCFSVLGRGETEDRLAS